MSQEDYDQGHEDGRRSRDEEVANLKRDLEWARGDLERERAEVKRYRGIVYRPHLVMDEVPV